MTQKVRIRFRKAGDLRFLSHHDLMRLFERALRRASLPFRSTEGFHPKPRMMFASALALGLVGQEEVLEIDMEDGPSPEEIQERLGAQMPAGLDILSVHRLPKGSSGQPVRATYRVTVPQGLEADLPARIDRVLQSTECWVERTRPQPKRINLRPYLVSLELGEGQLQVTVRITPNGSARPEEVLQALGLESLHACGAIIERVRLELSDEEQDHPGNSAGSTNRVES